MPSFKPTDTVQINTRTATAADVKSGLYYTHYAGLRGKILKIYGEEASVLVNRETLSPEVRTRHEQSETAMRQRWLDGLSEEGRNRLSAKDKAFTLNYAVLVALADLSPSKETEGDPVLPPAAATVGEKQSARDAAKSVAALNMSTGESATETNRRLSASDLDAAEADFLAQRSQN